MYKNAYNLGYKPVACKYLGSLFLYANGYSFPKNIKVSKKYYTEAQNLKV